jgi:C1A family cysteine protease
MSATFKKGTTRYYYLKLVISATPTAILIDGTSKYLQTYKSGILTSEEQCGSNINHAVLAVGFGTDQEAGDYFIIKNSWG